MSDPLVPSVPPVDPTASNDGSNDRAVDLGVKLRQLFDAAAAEALPPDFEELLRRLA